MKEFEVNHPNTWLIFFGKSQSFNFTVFNSQSLVANFDEIIPDFDLLESQLFTVDRADNRPILAKYNFKRKDEYTLLKLYSYAQAFAGDRVLGSIYGVAFLSEGNLEVCPENIEILTQIKSVFADLCLNSNSKFTKSDFSSSVGGIWKQFSDQNGFSKIKHIAAAKSINEGAVGIYTEKLADAKELPFEKVYFSEDIGHLKRTSAIWGARFPVGKIVNGQLLYNKEPESPRAVAKESTPLELRDLEIVKLKDTLKEKEVQLNQLENQIVKVQRKFKRIRFGFWSLAVVLVGIVTFLVWTNFFQAKERTTKKTTFNTYQRMGDGDSIRTSNLTVVQGSNSGFDINLVLQNNTNFTALLRLYSNIRNPNAQEKPETVIQAIIQDATTLNLPADFIAFFKSKLPSEPSKEKVPAGTK